MASVARAAVTVMRLSLAAGSGGVLRRVMTTL